MHGMELLNELSAATGLPDELIGEELSRIVSNAGKTTDSITLDELREMLASYLQDVLLDAKDSFLVEVNSEFFDEREVQPVTGAQKKMAAETTIKNETPAATVVEFASYRTTKSPDCVSGE